MDCWKQPQQSNMQELKNLLACEGADMKLEKILLKTINNHCKECCGHKNAKYIQNRHSDRLNLKKDVECHPNVVECKSHSVFRHYF